MSKYLVKLGSLIKASLKVGKYTASDRRERAIFLRFSHCATFVNGSFFPELFALLDYPYVVPQSKANH